MKKPGRFIAGYIFFQTVGSTGSKRVKNPLDMTQDENAVFFKGDAMYQTALQIRHAFEQGDFIPSNNKDVSASDELLKWKSLLDSGVINEEEFNMKKKQLLGL